MRPRRSALNTNKQKCPTNSTSRKSKTSVRQKIKTTKSTIRPNVLQTRTRSSKNLNSVGSESTGTSNVIPDKSVKNLKNKKEQKRKDTITVSVRRRSPRNKGSISSKESHSHGRTPNSVVSTRVLRKRNTASSYQPSQLNLTNESRRRGRIYKRKDGGKTAPKSKSEASTPVPVRASRRNTKPTADWNSFVCKRRPIVSTHKDLKTSSQHKKPSAKGEESCNIPECPLPCREEQFKKIWKFVFENIRLKTSGVLYIHGVPGAGKTEIVESVLNSLNTQMKNEKKDKFKCLFINGLKLSNPDKIWRTICRGLNLKGKDISSSTAHRKLLSYFESTKRIPVVLVVDELDQLLDNRQEILYRLLEWSSSAFNMFSLLAIFNTMSIPENVLTKQNDSRKGFSRALFEPYSHEQLELIVSNSLKHQVDNDTQLTQEAVRLICKKVAALSGDARRALEIARRALEHLQKNKKSVSAITAVRSVFEESLQPKVTSVKCCSMLQKQILKLICLEVEKSSEDTAVLCDVLDSLEFEAGFEGVSWTTDSFLSAVSRLEQMGLIALEKNGSSLHRRVMLNMPSDDVMYGININ